MMFKKFKKLLLLDNHGPQSHVKGENLTGIQKIDTSLRTINNVPVGISLKIDYKAPHNDPDYIDQIHKSIMESFHIPVGPDEIFPLKKYPKYDDENNTDRNSNDNSNSSSPIAKQTSLSPSLKSSSSSTGNVNSQTSKNGSKQSIDESSPRLLKKITQHSIPANTSSQNCHKLKVKSHRLTHERRQKMINFDYKYVKNKRTRMYKFVSP